MKKVGIIGGGPCGIFSAGAIGDTADVTIFERAPVMGGQWANHDDLNESDKSHLRSVSLTKTGFKTGPIV